MPDTPGQLAFTPGQINYQTYRTLYGEAYWPMFDRLSADERHAWEAAAQAVLEARTQPVSYSYRLGQMVRWSCEPEDVWHITYRAAHEDRTDGLRLFYGIRNARSGHIRMAEEADLHSTEDLQ